MSTDYVLKPEDWPYPAAYLRDCERIMADMGFKPEEREELMRDLARRNDPLAFLNAMEKIVRRGVQ